MDKTFICYIDDTKYVTKYVITRGADGKYGVFATEYDSWGYEEDTICVKEGTYEECIEYMNNVYINHLF